MVLLSTGFALCVHFAIYSWRPAAFQPLNAADVSLSPAKSDELGKLLDEKGLLNAALENVSISIPKEVTEELTYKTSIEDNMLNMDYYYGKQLLGSSSMQASDEILKATQELSSKKTLKTDASVSSNPKKENSEKSSLLPSWKYIALFLLIAGVLYYIILFIVKIKRSIKKQKQKKAKKHKR